VSINNDTSHYVYILIYTISYLPQPTMKVNIHNQCSNFKLQYVGCFSNGAYWDEKPDEELDTDSMISVGLRPFRAVFEGIIMYVLQGKHVESSNQLEPTYILLSMTWKSEGYKKLRVFSNLIECEEWSYWGTAELQEYYQRCAGQLCRYTGPIKDTWLIPDGAVLMTGLELDFTQRDGVLSVTISECTRNERTRKLRWVNPKL
jgi:hypothetical protein